MSLPKIKDLSNLTFTEIEGQILSLKKDLFDLKLKQATKQDIKTHLFKHKKHELAQLLTLETHKQDRKNSYAK